MPSPTPPPASQPPCRYVFVYGTLRRGEKRDINLLEPAPQWIGTGVLVGTLHDLGHYPGIVLAGSGAVRGEVYRISPELECILDEIEEVWPQQSGEYIKRDMQVLLDPIDERSSETLTCLVYEVAGSRTLGMHVIDDGDWVRHRLKKTP